MPLSPSKELETFPVPCDSTAASLAIRFECPEFTALCPKTGQPDFACVRIWYRPAERCVELKSLKMYLWSFRNEGHFHEAVTNKIRDDLVRVLEPMWLLVEGDFWVRGGIHTVVWAAHGPVPGELVTQRSTHFEYQAHG